MKEFSKFKKKYQEEKLDERSYAYFVDYLRNQLEKNESVTISKTDPHWVKNTEGMAANIASVCSPLSFALDCSVTPDNRNGKILIDKSQTSSSQTVINYCATMLAFSIKTFMMYFFIILLMLILHMGGCHILMSKPYIIGVLLASLIIGVIDAHHDNLKAKKFNSKALYF